MYIKIHSTLIGTCKEELSETKLSGSTEMYALKCVV